MNHRELLQPFNVCNQINGFPYHARAASLVQLLFYSCVRLTHYGTTMQKKTIFMVDEHNCAHFSSPKAGEEVVPSFFFHVCYLTVYTRELHLRTTNLQIRSVT
eukprot:scaffold572_cov229-Amphora_coffeaeformis.AAC.9